LRSYLFERNVFIKLFNGRFDKLVYVLFSAIILFFILISYRRQQRNQKKQNGIKHVESMKPMYLFEHKHFYLQPNDKGKGDVNGKCP